MATTVTFSVFVLVFYGTEDFDRICTNLKNAVESYNSGQPGPVQAALKAAKLIGITEKDTVWLTKAATIMERCVPQCFAFRSRCLPDASRNPRLRNLLRVALRYNEALKAATIQVQERENAVLGASSSGDRSTVTLV